MKEVCLSDITKSPGVLGTMEISWTTLNKLLNSILFPHGHMEMSKLKTQVIYLSKIIYEEFVKTVWKHVQNETANSIN